MAEVGGGAYSGTSIMNCIQWLHLSSSGICFSKPNLRWIWTFDAATRN